MYFILASDSEDEEGDKQPGASVKAKDLESQKTSKKSDVEEKNKSLVEKCENNVGKIFDLDSNISGHYGQNCC